MPRTSRSGSDKLAALIAQIEADAYARGRADARKELLVVLRSGGAPQAKAPRGRKARTAAAPRRRTRGRKRAPRGSVPRFVEQALGEQPGLTPPEILARAGTDMERLIKLASIRTELRNGRRKGKYEESGGCWSLAASGQAAEGAEDALSPEACSDLGEGESRDTLGLNL